MWPAEDEPDDRNANSWLPAGLAAALADQPLRIADRLDRLTGEVHDENSLLDLMYRIAGEAEQSMPDVDSAGVTARFDGAPFTMAHTHERVLAVDEGQYETGDGPCLRALQTGERVRMSTDQIQDTWPALGAIARAAGVETVLAIPVPVYGILPAAALNLYSSRAHAFEPVDEHTTTVLARYLGLGLTQYCDHQPELGRTMRLTAALESRRVIDTAVGTLMGADLGLTPDSAYEALRRCARAGELTVLAAAQMIIARPGGDTLPPLTIPDPPPRGSVPPP